MAIAEPPDEPSSERLPVGLTILELVELQVQIADKDVYGTYLALRQTRPNTFETHPRESEDSVLSFLFGEADRLVREGRIRDRNFVVNWSIDSAGLSTKALENHREAFIADAAVFNRRVVVSD